MIFFNQNYVVVSVPVAIAMRTGCMRGLASSFMFEYVLCVRGLATSA